ncbi:endonuclease domain-containing 1 protein-like [Toxotes jaculatrix]|uniref:endonuclease domain-containing 1 protein-like n=1 Tax=Toxotes jaculatrix TaxID=941984 RepID=UPI001B3ACDAE|nr:endonuclease domain-containing 1 protein-like [Toxotes jaculatrix]
MNMTSLKTQRFLPITVLLFLSIVPTVSEVVNSLSECEGFLLNETPPQVPGILENKMILDQNRYKIICQTYKSEKKFLTLYDTEKKIPVFSANKYRGIGENASRPNIKFMIEPQLECDKNMRNEEKNLAYKHQAENSDYSDNEMYNRGHLFPSSYGFSKADKESTFTLTNVVPQAKKFNNGSWNSMETCVKCIMDKHCINNNKDVEAYVVTGAQPGNKLLKERVNIPSMLWSAFCCYSSTQEKWIASAHWGDNVPDDPTGKHLETKTLEQLHDKLKTGSKVFEVFPETQCPLKTTVTELYPQMEKRCQCPPSSSHT